MNMRQVVKSWFSWRLDSLMVVMMILSITKPVRSQSDKNSTLIRYYCSQYHGMSETYFYRNLNTTLSSLRRQLVVNRVRYAVARTLFNGESVWGLASCRGYVSNENCVACYDYVVRQLRVCGRGNGVHAFYNDCDVRYEPRDFYADANIRARIVICGNTTSPQQTKFGKSVKGLISELRTVAPRTSNYYAASTREIPKLNVTVYAIAQCNLNLSESNCKDCLRSRYDSLGDCLPNTNGRAIDNGCFMRYSSTPFFGLNQTTNITPLLWDENIKNKKAIIGGVVGGVCFLLLVIAFFLWRLRSKKTGGRPQENSNNNKALIGGVVGGVCFLLLVIAFFLWRLRSKTTGGGHSSNVPKIDGAIGGVGLFILVVVLWLMFGLWKKSKKTEKAPVRPLGEPDLDEAIKYNYKHLQSATDNFSEENLVGKGGFGQVFKAVLDANNIVAVKKVELGYTNKVKEEFENEVKLISNTHHRNLLRLQGWSSEGSNLLLVLEYMSNGSLDKFLRGAKKGTLNWKQRYDIIFGIARGLHHLHNESHIKIIHRDIKSSNILLDHDFKPKIADFGLARFFPDDHSHLVSNRFVGTLGYIAPEYARHGILSDKVDTYSFGIVTLEIITGRRCTDVNFGRPSLDYLLEHAWMSYENKEHIKLIDETILDVNHYQKEHMMQIIEIALLCTQSPTSERPNISEVILMLTNDQPVRNRQLTRPILIDHDRRIHIGS